VTGGSAGLGLETCRVLLSKGAKVYLAARSRERSEEAINEIKKSTGKDDIHFLALDLSDLDSVRDAARTFLGQERQLHILYNNAGIMAVPYGVTKQGYESQWGTNVIGHFALTQLLLPILLETAAISPPGTVRVVNLSSNGHKLFSVPTGIDFDDVGLCNVAKYGASPEWKRYGQSKLGNVLFSNELARRYGDRGLISVSVHPGGVKTNLQNGVKPGFFTRLGSIISILLTSVQNGALTQLYAGTSPDIHEKKWNGRYFVPTAKLSTPSKHAQSAELAEKLWNYLEREVPVQGPI